MPVTFKFKAVPWPSSSNKHVGEGGEIYEVVYTYEVSNKGKVLVTHPFIDKISITFPVVEEDRQGMILEMMMDETKGETYPYLKHGARKGTYSHAVKIIDSDSGDHILLQAGPKKPQHNFARLEFNPSRIGPIGLSEFKARLEELTYGTLKWEHVIKDGKATRIDATVDLLNAPIGDVLYQSNEEGKLHIYVGQSGDLQTVYPGLKKAGKASDVLIYDKTQHEVDAKLPLGYGGDRCRVEMIYKYSNQKFINIADIKNNVFSRVTLYHPGEAPEGVDTAIWGLFLDSCQLRGLKNALGRLPQEMRDTFQPHLEEVAKRTWKPEKLWALWPSAVKKSGLLEP